MSEPSTKRERYASSGLRRDIDEAFDRVQESLEEARAAWPTDRAKALAAADELRVRSKELRDGIAVAARDTGLEGEPLQWNEIGDILEMTTGAAYSMFGGSWEEIREANRERKEKKAKASNRARETFPWWSLKEAADICGITMNAMYKRAGGKPVEEEGAKPRPGGKLFPGVRVDWHKRRSGNWVARYDVDESLIVNREAVPEKDRHRFPNLFPEA
ncbi:hypothetical protein [Sinomonas sp. RB5]